MADLAIIKDFHLGIGPSEFEGNGEITNIDLSWRKGVARIALEAQTATASVSLVQFIVANKDVSNQLWAADDGTRLYRGTAFIPSLWSQASTLGGAAKGLTVWKNYVFGFRAAAIDTYGPLDGSAVLTAGWQAIDNDGDWHPSLVGQDDILYFGAGRYIGSIQEATGSTFTPGSAGTYIFSPRALDLPATYRTRTLAELGKNLMIGTWAGVNIDEQKVADIFPWDRVSDSFNLPIKLYDNGIQAMLTVNNLLYFFAGLKGRLYVTDGTNVQQLAKIPEQIIDLSGDQTLNIYPNSMIEHENKILFGVSSGPTSSSLRGRVWAYNLETGGLTIENTIGTGTSVGLNIGALFSNSVESYILARRDSSDNYAFDDVVNNSRYSSYSATLTSPYLQLGSNETPVDISEIEVFLARPLRTNEGVRLLYRTDLSAAFTEIATVDFATYAGTQGENLSFKLQLKTGIQIRALLTTGSGATTSPELIKLVLR